MGILADSVLASGGLVTGVIPEHLFELEVGHTGISDMRIVSSMHERKAVMASESSAFIAMPGGFGTFEEICEIITWAQLGLHHKPIGFLNIAGYFNPLMSAFDLGVTEKFISHQHRDMIICEDSVSTLVKRIADGIKNPDLVKF